MPFRLSSLVLVSVSAALHAASQETPLSVGDAAVAARADVLIATGSHYLESSQVTGGSFGAPDAKMALGITALVTAALNQPPALDATDAHLVAALTYLQAHQQPDGGFYLPEEGLAIYGTSLALTALVQAPGTDPLVVQKAQHFIVSAQVANPASPSAGGIGYGGPKSPDHADLSNTHMALRALRRSGMPVSDPCIQKAIGFLEHCQELSSVNHLPWVDSSPQEAGGGVYNPDPKPRPPATVATKPSAYGSMTCALLDGYRQSGVDLQDLRPQQALQWLSRQYTLAENPGRAAGKSADGLFYYYWMMAEALSGAHLTTIQDAAGTAHDWRAEMVQALETRLHHDPHGDYWVNDAKTWSETNPIIVTSYVVQTLKCIRSTF